jgi:chromosome segregation protein
MRFHKIEMTGFKSFVDKTNVTLQEGITAVVGPNGCGKSNISDAIRWVLGEKSAKNLRGDKMEDVIFNGSEMRKPLGMAEVNLTLQDVEGGGTTGFAEFKELTITRRLYRSGDSEYLINKIPCRLKDIRDLLMDTGVGSRAYSIIEQGKIGQLVVAKPEERRYIIEEVAGITRYKTRKNEALAKLKETTDNLDRVNDIIHEVKRQINSLDRQAKKAEKYKALSAELKRIELKMAWDDHVGLTERIRLAEQDYERVSADEDAARNAVSAREADISEARLMQAEKERELVEFQREIHSLEAEASHMEARAELAETQLRDLDEREARMVLEKSHLEKEEQDLLAQASSLKEEQLALKEELDALQEELKVLENAFASKSGRVREIEEDIDTSRSRLFDIQNAVSQKTNRMSRLEERRAELEVRLLKAGEEEHATREMRVGAQVAKDKKELELRELQAEGQELEKERQSLASALAANKEQLKALDEKISAGRAAYSQKNSRLQSLMEFEENLEGYGEAVKALMEGSRQGRISGLHGLVADMLQTDKRYEKAIEAALGDRLQNVVVDGHADAKAAMEHLKSSGLGRGTFIPVSPRIGGITGAPVKLNGEAWPAMELVRPKDGYAGIFSALLGRVLVAADLDVAASLWESFPEHTVVTLDGEVLEPYGSLTGGSQSTAGGILSKKREIRELTTEVSAIETELKTSEERHAELKKETEGFESGLKTLHDTIGENRVATVGAEKDLASLEAELGRVLRKIEVLEVEAAQREQEELEISEGMSLLRTELEEASAARQDKEGLLADLQEELKVVKAEMEDEREALTGKKMEMSALLQKHESSARDIKLADVRKEELARKSDRLAEEAAGITLRREELGRGKEEAVAKVDTLMRTVVEKKGRLPEIQNAYQSASDMLAGLEEAVKISRRDAEAAFKAASELNLKLAELKMKVEYLEETVHKNYHITVDGIGQEIKDIEIDRDEAEMNAAELGIKIERLGPVNVGAIDEYNELMERFEFLNTQKDDLDASVRRLKEAITKINKTSEELFMEAFDAINEQFKSVFEALFGGGSAELQLVLPESGDLLDAGLDIVARPPGKKLQNLTLFSGGEKALIAAALVFACFLVKPSPFCVLDEVDAPLDEANVDRFGNLVKKFSDKTQFIVITHSRPTMELANALYGVTMDEPGVSRLVSVRVKEAVEMAEA